MIKQASIAVSLALALAACGHVAATKVENEQGSDADSYRLEFQYGAVDSHATMMEAFGRQATELCPQGWVKTKESVEDRGAALAPLYVWQIRCVDDA